MLVSPSLAIVMIKLLKMAVKKQTTNDPAIPYLNVLERVTATVKNNNYFLIWRTTFLEKPRYYFDQGFGHEGSCAKMVVKNLIILPWGTKFRPDLVLVLWQCLFTPVWNIRHSEQCTDGSEWTGRKWCSHNSRHERAFSVVVKSGGK